MCNLSGLNRKYTETPSPDVCSILHFAHVTLWHRLTHNEQAACNVTPLQLTHYWLDSVGPANAPK